MLVKMKDFKEELSAVEQIRGDQKQPYKSKIDPVAVAR